MNLFLDLSHSLAFFFLLYGAFSLIFRLICVAVLEHVCKTLCNITILYVMY